MAKRGRPSKYDPKYCEEVIDYLGQGYSKEAFAGHIDVSEDTIYEWIKVHSDFSEAIKKAKAKSRIWWEDLGREMVMQGGGNAPIWIFNMKNRFGWKDKTETELVGKGGQQIPIFIFGGGFLPQSPTALTTPKGTSFRLPPIQDSGMASTIKKNDNGTVGVDTPSPT